MGQLKRTVWTPCDRPDHQWRSHTKIALGLIACICTLLPKQSLAKTPGWTIVPGSGAVQCHYTSGINGQTGSFCNGRVLMINRETGWLYLCGASVREDFKDGRVQTAIHFEGTGECRPLLTPNTDNDLGHANTASTYSGDLASSNPNFPITVNKNSVDPGLVYWTAQSENYDVQVCFVLRTQRLCGPVEYSPTPLPPPPP